MNIIYHQHGKSIGDKEDYARYLIHCYKAGRFHKGKSKNLTNLRSGTIILERLPQYQSVPCYSFEGLDYGEMAFKRMAFKRMAFKRMAFPYLYFVVSYVTAIIDGEEKFFYNGFYGRGLIVYCANKPIQTNLDTVQILPNELANGGIVCTDHSYDYTQFDTLKELTDTVITLWFSTPFEGIDYSEWSAAKLEDILKMKWPHKFNFCSHLSSNLHFFDKSLKLRDNYSYTPPDRTISQILKSLRNNYQ